MADLLSRSLFVSYLHQFRGIPAESINEAFHHYDGAARGAAVALRSLPSFGFFSSQEQRAGGFVAVCKQLDQQIEDGKVTPDEAYVAVLLMMGTDKSFYKAFKA